jgi:hypothetical protein
MVLFTRYRVYDLIGTNTSRAASSRMNSKPKGFPGVLTVANRKSHPLRPRQSRQRRLAVELRRQGRRLAGKQGRAARRPTGDARSRRRWRRHSARSHTAIGGIEAVRTYPRLPG